MREEDFPVGPVVKNPPTKFRRISYATEKLKPMHHNYSAYARTITAEPTPALLKSVDVEPMLHNKRSRYNEKPARCTAARE